MNFFITGRVFVAMYFNKKRYGHEKRMGKGKRWNGFTGNTGTVCRHRGTLPTGWYAICGRTGGPAPA